MLPPEEPDRWVPSSSMLRRVLRLNATGREELPLPPPPVVRLLLVRSSTALAALSKADGRVRLPAAPPSAAASAGVLVDIDPAATKEPLRLDIAAGTLTAVEEGQKVDGQQCPATVSAGSKQLSAGPGGLCPGHETGTECPPATPPLLLAPVAAAATAAAAAAAAGSRPWLVAVLVVLSALLLMLPGAVLLLLLLLELIAAMPALLLQQLALAVLYQRACRAWASALERQPLCTWLNDRSSSSGRTRAAAE